MSAKAGGATARRGGASAAGRGATTVRAVLGGAVPRLMAAGCATPGLDAEVLLGHVLGVERAALHVEPDRSLTPAQERRFGRWVERRAGREPVAYILGRRAFRSIELAVDPRVLIPRPETELLVEVARRLAPGARVVDVGTGSGAIALALAQERPDLRLTATDVSADALAVARRNARALRLAVRFLHADLLEGVGGLFDAVLANPPYVGSGEHARLEPEIADFEPRAALLAGDDGLDVLRRLIPQGARALAARGLLAVEVGRGQAATVGRLMEAAGLMDVQIVRDLAGIERVVTARRW